jgi:hypothetical protein
MPSLTPDQQALLVKAYLQDASKRGLDAYGQVDELLSFIFAPRATQLTQLRNLVQRVRNSVSDQQVVFDAAKTTELTALNSLGTNLDDLITTLPTIT